jgi:phosphonate transport system substrate-binding protein
MITLKSKTKNQKSKIWRADQGGFLYFVFYILFFVLSSMGCGNISRGSLDQEAIKMAVLPAYSTNLTSQKYLPLLNYLSRETGYEIQYIWGQGYSGLGAAIETSGADFVICDPLSYLTLQRTHRARPLVISIPPGGRAEVTGLIFVSPKSSITDPLSLKGKLVACASMQSSEGFISQATYLRSLGLLAGRDYRLLICGTMDEVVRKVASGQAEAGFGAGDCLGDSVTVKMVALASTTPVPGWLCLSLKSDNYEVEEKLTQAFLRLSQKNPEHKKVLDDLGYQGFSVPEVAGLKGLADKAQSLDIPY